MTRRDRWAPTGQEADYFEDVGEKRVVHPLWGFSPVGPGSDRTRVAPSDLRGGVL